MRHARAPKGIPGHKIPRNQVFHSPSLPCGVTMLLQLLYPSRTREGQRAVTYARTRHRLYGSARAESPKSTEARCRFS